MPMPKPSSTDRVIGMVYDHLLTHPFFDESVRAYLGISKKADVSENEHYWAAKEQLIDETLVALIALNKSGARKD